MGSRQENPAFMRVKFDFGGAKAFDTETGQGNPAVLVSFKKSCKNAASIVISQDPLSREAYLLRHWARQKKWVDPDMEIVVATFRKAGLMASSFSSDDFGTEAERD